MVVNILGNTGPPTKLHDMMYKAVVQVVLLYGSESWVVTDAIMIMLEGFYHRIDKQIAGMIERKIDGGEWEWTLVDLTLDTTGIWPLRGYMSRQK